MIEQMAANLSFIRRGWLNANHFVFNGQRKILIDTGYKKDLANTLALIRAAGVEPASVELIISTHSHCDHVGATRHIQDISGCEVAMHPIDKYFIDSKNDWYTWWRYYDQEADFFQVTHVLREGDTVKLDGLELDVIHAPGHAAGMIALYCPRHEFLISSDAVWDGDFGVFTTRIEGMHTPFLQQQTLEKLDRLKLTTIYPGHGARIDKPKEAIRKCRQRLESFLEKPQRMGRDQLKKLMIYCLMMKDGLSEDNFFAYLMGTHWFPEVTDLYFHGEYRQVYDDILTELTGKQLIKRDKGKLLPTLDP
jgi:glyoxylase-like metal-dependent hydrolase (beta-lactamase superfamily II)